MIAEGIQSANAEMMAWALRWRIARLRKDASHDPRASRPHGAMGRGLPAWSCTYALLYAEAGDHERGRRHVRRVMDAGLVSIPFDSEWVELLWSLGEAAMLLDERDAVSAVLDALVPYADLWAVDGYGAACFGKVADLLSDLAEWLGRPTSKPLDHASFVRTGTVWRLAFRGRAVSVVDSKGMRDLAVLLARPGREVHVLDLVEASGGPARGEAGTDTGPMIDAAARAAYRRRLADLEEEIATAEQNSDLGQLADAGSREGFPHHRTGGRLRSRWPAPSRRRPRGKGPEGRRDAARHRSEGDRGPASPNSARHLRISTSTGRTCCYRPEQESPGS